MTTLDVQDIQAWLTRCGQVFEAEMAHLSQLDGALGDGDHGTSMVRGFRALAAKLAAGNPAADSGALLQTAGMTILSATGGATGPLFGTIFLEAARQARGKTELTLQDLALMFVAASSGVATRGATKAGEKTMLDALEPAAQALRAAAAEGQELAAGLARAAQAAEDGAAATSSMLAQKGRARYLGQRSLGHQDAGATSVALIMRALADVAARPL
jgi:phosphoenolpyruvate---glycerone phosphotransferase subunit DhaL